MNKINVAIVDDNEKIVSLLDNILQKDENIEVVGKADNRMGALDVIRERETGCCAVRFDYAKT